MNHRFGLFPLLAAAAVFLYAAFPVRLAAEELVHVVAKGDTIYSISRSYRVSPDELMKHNGIADPSKLQMGTSLRIPGSSAGSEPVTQSAGSGNTAAVYTGYQVQKNDTLYSLARKYGITVQALRSINGFSSAYIIKAGERIRVPDTGSRAPAGPPPGDPKPPPSPGIPGKQLDASLRWPVRPKGITYLTGKLNGVLLLAEQAEAVTSLTQGTVKWAGSFQGYGRMVIVRTQGGYDYVYGGCESLSVKEGDRIGPGTELGKLGVDPDSGKSQLVFMVYRNNTPIDPAKAPRA